MKRKIAAILAADVAGYSRLVADDEEDTLRRLASYRDVFSDFVTRANGRVFNTAGDSVLAEFSSAVEATRCAIDIQESLRTRNLGYPSTRQMLFRIGITIGDVVEREGDLLGDGVNIAARLEGLAGPGGICVSRSVYEQVANKLSVPFRDIGEQEVKNIPQRVHAFMVEMHGAEPLRPPLARQNVPASGGGRLTAVLAGAGLGLGLAALVIVLLRPTAPPPPPPVANAKAAAPATNVAANAANTTPPAPAPAANTAAAPAAPTVPADATPAVAFAILARNGGIIHDAKTAPELYHNARNFEARGDPLGARREYLALASMGSDAIDPALRFAALLQAQEGRDGARQVFGRLHDTTGGRVATLVYSLQFEADERRKRLESFIAANPDFAPAQYLLAEEYSEDRLGSQTLADKRKEFAALGEFLHADAQGRLVPFFLDQSVLAEWLDQARKRHARLETYLKTAIAAPVATFLRSNSGWSVALSLPEPATKISYRVGKAGEFAATGTLPVIDQRTGKPLPNTSFELPADAAAATIEVRYEDAEGRTLGPFPIEFDPRAALVKDERDILERFWTGWIGFNTGGEQQLAYFTHLVTYRCAIAKANMGFDDGPLATTLPIPNCDERDPHAVPADVKPYVALPRGTKSVAVQLTYVDGTSSERKTFRLP